MNIIQMYYVCFAVLMQMCEIIRCNIFTLFSSNNLYVLVFISTTWNILSILICLHSDIRCFMDQVKPSLPGN